ncbi:MAG: PadR family transcriptional regulator [Chloroflexota bacterium]
MKLFGSFGQQLAKGTTPMLVLAVIGDGELYGYDIAQRIRERSGGAFAPSEGALYPALHRLEAEGALVAVWRDSDRGPRRRYYRLTDQGRGLLASSKDEWTSFAQSVERVALGGGDG